jgi:hypothetical protein
MCRLHAWLFMKKNAFCEELLVYSYKNRDAAGEESGVV